jgi:putative transposase
VLSYPAVARILVKEWMVSGERYGWSIGRYVIMPDHVHFFAAPSADAKPMPQFVGEVEGVDVQANW